MSIFNSKPMVEQYPKVQDDGIWVPVEVYVPEGSQSYYKLLMSKEMFIEAHNKYINKRMYKGGWKR